MEKPPEPSLGAMTSFEYDGCCTQCTSVARWNEYKEWLREEEEKPLPPEVVAEAAAAAERLLQSLLSK